MGECPLQSAVQRSLGVVGDHGDEVAGKPIEIDGRGQGWTWHVHHMKQDHICETGATLLRFKRLVIVSVDMKCLPAA
jgi:hypothetical protein